MIVTLTLVSALAFLSLCFSLLQRLCWRVTETSLLELSGFHPLTIISYSRIQSPRAPSAAAPTQSHWSSQWTAKGEIDLFPSFLVMYFFQFRFHLGTFFTFNHCLFAIWVQFKATLPLNVFLKFCLYSFLRLDYYLIARYHLKPYFFLIFPMLIFLFYLKHNETPNVLFFIICRGLYCVPLKILNLTIFFVLI